MRVELDISILIVCNEQYTLDTLSRELADSAYKVNLEKDIMKAAESPEGRFNLALLCILPSNVKSMLALLELLGHRRPNMACIIISAVDDASIVTECLLRGAVSVLTAPVNKKQIIAAILDVVRGDAEKKEFIKFMILEDDPVSGK